MGDIASGQFVDSTIYNPDTFDVGDFKWSARRFAAAGWLKCDGAAVSRTTYAALFDAIVPVVGTFTVTLASPGVFTLASHGLIIGDRVYLTTTGALPTGLAANTIYYVVSTPTSGTFTLSASEGGAAINTSGSQSGIHTLYSCPHGLGDGSTTFNVPDAPGRTLVAAAGASGHSSVRVQGQSDGVALANRSPRHNGTVVDTGHAHGSGNGKFLTDGTGTAAGITGSGGSAVAFPAAATTATATTGITVGPGGTLPVDQPANLVANLFIKHQSAQ